MRTETIRVENPAEAGKRMLRESGYANGGSVSEGELKRVVRKALIGHEDDEHEGEHRRIKVKSGGKVAGRHAKHRPDRRRANGGGMPEGTPEPGGERNRADEGRARGGGMKKGKAGVNITIKTGGGEDGQQKEQMAAQQGMRIGQALGARRAAQAMQGPPPGGGMGGPPPGAIPPGGPMAGPAGPRPPMPGGPPMGARDGGKIKVKAHQRRRAGGRVEDCG